MKNPHFGYAAHNASPGWRGDRGNKISRIILNRLFFVAENGSSLRLT